MQKKSYDAVDLAKWLCSFCVVYIHVNPLQMTYPMLDSFIAQGLCRLAVPLFYAISAYLLFKTMDGANDRKKVGGFIKRTLLLYTVWVLVYAAYRVFYNWYNGVEQDTVLDYVRRFFLVGESFHLWYLASALYAIPVVYLLRKSSNAVLITVCVAGNLAQCIDQFFQWGPVEDLPVLIFLRGDCATLYFTVLRAIPMMCLGILCLRSYDKRSAGQWLIRLAAALGIFAVEVFLWSRILRPQYAVEALITAPLAVFCLVNWLFKVNFNMPVKWIGKALRYSSTWIYCVHVLVMLSYHWIFAYTGMFHYAFVVAVSFLSGIPYMVIKIAVETRKKRRQILSRNC